MAGEVLSNGTTIGIDNADSPLTYTSIENVTAIRGPSQSGPAVSTKHLGSTVGTSLRGIKDGGSIEVAAFLECDASPAEGPLIANGATISIAGGAIAKVTSISGPSQERPTADVTHLGSTAREFLGGIEDGGTVDLEMLLVPTDTSGQDVFLDKLDDGSEAAIVVTLSNAATISFTGLVTAHDIGVQTDDGVRVSASLKVTGAVTLPTLAAGQQIIKTVFGTGAAREYKITLPGGAGNGLADAIVTSLATVIALDQPVELNIGLKVTDTPTLSWQ